jgi:hypothetical protein
MKSWLQLVIVFGLVISSTALGQLRMIIKGDLNKLETLLTSKSRSLTEKEENVTLDASFNLPGFGIYRVSIDRAVQKYWTAYYTNAKGTFVDPTEVLLLKGTLYRRPSSRRSAQITRKSNKKERAFGIVIKNNKGTKIRFFLRGDLKNVSRSKMFTVEAPLLVAPNKRVLISANSRIRSLPAGKLIERTCQTNGLSLVPAASSQSPTRRASGVASVSTDADYEYFLQFGNSTNATIAANVLAASELYNSPFGVTFTIASQHVFTTASDPYGQTAPESMLEEFQTYHQRAKHIASADIYHLFTGKNIQGSTIGVAYVGVVCALNSSFSYGVSQAFHPSADYVVFAHEVGHNFGATHDTSDLNSIMYPSANLPPATRWSTQSQQEIKSFLNGATCLGAPAQPTPRLTPTTFSGGGPGVSPTVVGGSTFSAQLRASQRRGRVRLGLSFSPWNSTCAARLYGSVASAGLSERVLLSTQLVSTTSSFTSKVNGTARGFLSLRLEVRCESNGQTALSDTVSLRMGGAEKRSIRAANWVKQFQKLKPY